MTVLSKLKLTQTTRIKTQTREEQLRSKLLEHLDEQLEIVKAEQAGQQFTKTRLIYTTNENGERVKLEKKQRVKKWYWEDAGKYYLELRYGNRALQLDGDNTAIEVGTLKELAKTVETVKQAVNAGELDEALMAAKVERRAMLRKAVKE